MKSKIFIFLFLLFSCKDLSNPRLHEIKESKIVTSSNKNDTIRALSTKKTAFQIYEESLSILEQIVESGKPYDHSDGFEAVAHLTEISGYEGGGNHNYFGTFGFKDEDLKYWKKWFLNNKDSLDYIYIPESDFPPLPHDCIPRCRTIASCVRGAIK